MTIYLFGSNTCGGYQDSHSGIVTDLELAKGFKARGHDVICLWGERAEHGIEFEGIRHERCHMATPGPGDLLFITHLISSINAPTTPNFQAAGTRWLWASSFYGFNATQVWKNWYHRIFVEGPGATPMIQQHCPNVPVHHVMTGCDKALSLEALENPYPAEGKHLFFAGRLWRAEALKQLMSRLPAEFHLWVAVQTAEINVPARGSVLLLSEDKNYKGMTEIETQPNGQRTYIIGWTEFETHLQNYMGVEAARVHCIGRLPYRSFFHYQHHAFAVLDSCTDTMPISVNCKIIDPLRSGARIITEGLSPSFYLIPKYQAGCCCAPGDFDTMAQTLCAWQEEPLELKCGRGYTYGDRESWTERAAEMLDLSGYGG